MFEVKEKPKMVEKAYLIGVRQADESEREAQYLLEELAELVKNMNVGIVGKEVVKIREPKARYLLGTGKTEEMVTRVKAAGADCIVFDVPLAPSQQRNWETASGLCVIDRQEVILDIFGDRAQTKEAVLQVELARMEYSMPRLKNAWTHLSRQRGGGVTQRGEGEAQIELDQRMVRTRIARLKKELDEVIQHREIQRKQRMRVPVPTCSIVGYTNAGKSSLLNRLTGADLYAADKLFATLDPTTRQLTLPQGQKLLVTDTVGFVRRLPHRLVEAFKATLEEAVVADFLIHVLDITNPDYEEHAATTLGVLKELGADEKRILTVYNKIDCFPEEEQDDLIARRSNEIYVSAQTGQGIPELLDRMTHMLEDGVYPRELLLPHDRYDLVNTLHRAGAVKRERATDEGVIIEANLPPRLVGRFEAYVVNGSNGH